MPSPAPRLTPQSPETFRAAAKETLETLQGCVRQVIAEVAGPGVNSLALSRLLAIDKSLGWRMARFAATADPFAASANLPGEAGLRIFARAVRAGTASIATVDALDRAVAQLSALIRDHARTRASFRAMLAQIAEPGGEDPRVIEYRKSAFHANAAIWGIEATCVLKSVFVLPGAVRGTLDIAVVSACTGLQRMRNDVSWPVFNRRITHEGATIATEASPLDPALARDALPLVAAHSTLRADQMHVTQHGPELRCWLPRGDVGRNGSVDCVFGERHRGIDTVEFPGDPGTLHVALRNDLPSERAILDVWIHGDTQAVAEPDAQLASTLTHAPEANGTGTELRRLPFRPAVRAVTPREAAAEGPVRYGELLDSVTAWLGTPADRFVGHRVAMRYPTLSTEIVATLRTPVTA